MFIDETQPPASTGSHRSRISAADAEGLTLPLARRVLRSLLREHRYALVAGGHLATALDNLRPIGAPSVVTSSRCSALQQVLRRVRDDQRELGLQVDEARVVLAALEAAPTPKKLHRPFVAVAIPMVPGRPIALPNVVKLVTGERRKSWFRDSDYLRDHHTLRETAPMALGRELSVKRVSPATLPAHHQRGPKTQTWWERSMFDASQPRPRQYRLPADWRDTTDSLKIHVALQALKAQGPTHGFTINLRPDIETGALARPDAAAWLTARIARSAKSALGRTLECFVVLEQAEGRLHLHGAGNLDAHEADKVRKAFRKAAGEWPATRQHQVHTSADPDAAWAGYCAKGLSQTGAYMRELNQNSRFRRVTFNGPAISVTKATASKSAQTYAADRAEVIEYRRLKAPGKVRRKQVSSELIATIRAERKLKSACVSDSGHVFYTREPLIWSTRKRFDAFHRGQPRTAGGHTAGTFGLWTGQRWPDLDHLRYTHTLRCRDGPLRCIRPSPDSINLQNTGPHP